MPDLPWFPLWVHDFGSSRRVKLMSLDAVGLYTLLLIEQWKDGPIPDDVEQIAILCGRHSNAIAKAWKEVRPCFAETPEGLVNLRLEEERNRQEVKHQRRVKAGKKGAKVRWAQEDNSNANGNANAVALRNHKQSESEPDTEEEKTTFSNADAVRAVFDHWREVSGHTGCRLTPDRRSKIAARLKTYSVDDLKRALDVGCADPFYRGQNDRGKRYDFPETLLKNDSKVDQFLSAEHQNGNGAKPKPKHPYAHIPGIEDSIREREAKNVWTP